MEIWKRRNHTVRGKGDHRHVGDKELPYDFINVEKLLTDFWQAVGDWI